MKKKVHLGVEGLKGGPCSFKDASDKDLIQEVMSRKGAKEFVIRYTEPAGKDKPVDGGLEARIELVGTARPDQTTASAPSSEKKPKLSQPQAEMSEDDDPSDE
jgi:hypothetical protein